MCPDCAKVPIVVETVCSRRIRTNNWPTRTPAVPPAQDQPIRATAALLVRANIMPTPAPEAAIRTTAALPVRTSFAPDALGPDEPPFWDRPHQEFPRCGCTRLVSGCPESLDMVAYSALCAEARALVAAGHARIGLERLRAMVSPKLAEPLAYWPWRDLVEQAGFAITRVRPGHPAEVVLQ